MNKKAREALPINVMLWPCLCRVLSNPSRCHVLCTGSAWAKFSLTWAHLR